MNRTRLLALLLLSLILSFALPTFAQDALPLTQHYVSDDERIAFSYPADWVIDKNNAPDSELGISIATTQAALNKGMRGNTTASFEPGEAYVTLLVASKAELQAVLKSGGNVSIADLVRAIIKTTTDDGNVWGDVSEITVNRHEVARASFNSKRLGHGSVMLVEYPGDTIGMMGVLSAANEGEQWEATALAILDSLTISVPAVEATAEATPTEEPSGINTYTSPNKAATFTYPDGWIITEQSDADSILDVAVSSSESASDKFLGSGDDTFESGEVKVQLLVINQNVFLSDPNLDPNSTPIDILTTMQTQGSIPEGMSMSVVSATSLHDLPGAQFQFEIGKQGEGRVVLIRYRPGLLMLMAVFTAPGELAQGNATAQAIFESLTLAEDAGLSLTGTPEPLDYTLPPSPTPGINLPQSATSKNGKNTLSYPAEWVTRNSGNTAIYVANSTKALNHQLGGTFATGEVQILISVDSIANLTPGINLGLKSDATTTQVLASLMKATSSFLTFDEPEEISINGMTASTVVLHGKHYEGRSIIIDFGDKVTGLVQVLAAPDELVNWTDTINAIVESVVHSE